MPPSTANGATAPFGSGVGIPELVPLRIEESRSVLPGGRLNLVIPLMSEGRSYGGMPTARRFFERLSAEFPYARLILTHEVESRFEFSSWSGWTVDDGSPAPRSIAFLGDGTTSLSLSSEDVFAATFWSTAAYVKQVLARQIQLFPGATRRFVYLIQDYEPGFYPYSARHACALDSYRDGDQVIAVFNTQLLAGYFRDKGLRFPEQYVFEPTLHPRLGKVKRESADCNKERLIFMYGRPSIPRNDFDLLVEALRLWVRKFPSAGEWSLVSAGEQHADIPLGDQRVLQSKGKLSLEDYGRYLSQCWVGLSFIFSPHPGYATLDMAEFGAWVITNKFENKHPTQLAPHIVCVDPTPAAVAEKLTWCCEQYRPGQRTVSVNGGVAYQGRGEEFPFASALVKSWRSS